MHIAVFFFFFFSLGLPLKSCTDAAYTIVPKFIQANPVPLCRAVRLFSDSCCPVYICLKVRCFRTVGFVSLFVSQWSETNREGRSGTVRITLRVIRWSFYTPYDVLRTLYYIPSRQREETVSRNRSYQSYVWPWLITWFSKASCNTEAYYQ